MPRILLSGNEAVARGAWEAGVSVGSGYPGTPSTEIMEAFAHYPEIYAEWATNEKVALDAAIGAAYAGKRSFSTMKHVGLNVAADSLFYVGMTGIEAGLMIVSADDPSMHSSQNEQDNRQYARFARIPCLDPSDSQDAYDFARSAFDISEQFDTPVLLRLTTRVCHTSAPVQAGSQRAAVRTPGKYPRNIPKYVTMPANSRLRHPIIEQRIKDISQFAETFAYNKVEMRSLSLGIITGGIAYQYAREVFPDASTLKLGMVHPLPRRLISQFASQVEKVIVLEELDPFIEQQVRLMGIKLFGISDTDLDPNTKTIFPITGELNPAIVRESAVKAGLLAPVDKKVSSAPLPLSTGDLPARPPVLCPGCPHRSSFYVLHKLGVPVNGDIGCYTLGVVQPLDAIHTCGCMGAGIGVAHGAYIAGDTERHVAVIGDSTFFHTGIPALINAAYNKSNIITIIMDNRVTGMTGHQDNPGTGKTLMGQETISIDIEALVRSLGIKQVAVVDAYDVKAIEKILKGWMEINEPCVLITREMCALLPEARKRYLPLQVNEERCNGCTLCFRIGCPAIEKSEKLDPKLKRPLARINPQLCTGCQICAQVCPRNAIFRREEMAARQSTAAGEHAS